MRETMKTSCLLLAALVAGYVGGLMSQRQQPAAFAQEAPPAAPTVLTAQRIELKDGDGKTRLVLAAAFDTQAPARIPQPGIRLYDAAGKPRGEFLLQDGEPQLILRDTTGETRGGFALLNDQPSLTLHGNAGQPKGKFSIGPDGDPMLALYDGGGKIRGWFYLGRDGSPMLSFDDGAGKTRGTFAVLGNTPSVILRDALGRTIWSAP